MNAACGSFWIEVTDMEQYKRDFIAFLYILAATVAIIGTRYFPDFPAMIRSILR